MKKEQGTIKKEQSVKKRGALGNMIRGKIKTKPLQKVEKIFQIENKKR